MSGLHWKKIVLLTLLDKLVFLNCFHTKFSAFVVIVSRSSSHLRLVVETVIPFPSLLDRVY